MKLYGAPGYGSAITEGILALAGIPFDYVDVSGFETPGPARTHLYVVNPLGQVPAVVLDDGTILTESAAIALYFSAGRPDLAPQPGHPDHARFLRLLVWLVANVYPTFTYGDDPVRWTQQAPDELRDSTDDYRLRLYAWLETQIAGPFVLGTTPGILDIYLSVMTTWRPRMAWFSATTPKIAAIATRTRALEILQPMVVRNGFSDD
ncbi:glutathione S-transferase family protein [Tanticharoenia sakaeratensis]|uniref:Glutathione S-transferase, N-terminal domain protein n=1 Tax=Tanticharoenia sakaeratensis NBRC 103193 TaxID=1231623 RepID=A0A0D6MKU7_9PROT|nr:glutathione S-transferase family protein [Tanticharoenia sakaeratensis]GAN53898.1 glutathione S-transferase, N-terminal domain protein [Tanticharoenia sakaeratensis NBRC 103193]GBQ25207.1 glutathione S-transferase [Tanticharoenia sakaeratensis NBRC 103193]